MSILLGIWSAEKTVGCLKLVATLTCLQSNFQTSLNYRVRLFQNTCICLLYGYQCFDFFPFTCWRLSWLFPSSAQLLLNWLSYWYVGLYIYFKIYFYLCVCVNVRVWIYREHVKVRGQLFWPLLLLPCFRGRVSYFSHQLHMWRSRWFSHFHFLSGC